MFKDAVYWQEYMDAFHMLEELDRCSSGICSILSSPFQVCFSNEFSTFSHKLIYVDFQVGDEPQLPGVGDHFTAMTQVSLSFFVLYLHII